LPNDDTNWGVGEFTAALAAFGWYTFPGTTHGFSKAVVHPIPARISRAATEQDEEPAILVHDSVWRSEGADSQWGKNKRRRGEPAIPLNEAEAPLTELLKRPRRRAVMLEAHAPPCKPTAACREKFDGKGCYEGLRLLPNAGKGGLNLCH
jgi:hypothetical protein